MVKLAPTRDRFDRIAESIAGIESEMKRIGYWSVNPLPDQAYEFSAAFAMDTMSFTQWLQFVFIPRVRQVLEERGSFPGESMVGVQAAREFDGDEKADRLVRLLSKFDDFFQE